MGSLQGSNVLKLEEKYTLDQWRAWSDEERWELIEGQAYSMSPAPPRIHQELVGHIYEPNAKVLLHSACAKPRRQSSL